MTTKEFINKLNILGYTVEKRKNHVRVLKDDDLVANISSFFVYELDTEWEGMCNNEELFDVMVEYAKTPIEEREEQEEFYWKLKGNMDDSYCYINFNKKRNTVSIDNKHETGTYKSVFTENEFKELCKKHGMVYEAFEKEPIN